MGVDADRVESLGELAADQVGPLPVGCEADDADGSAGPGVARHPLADGAPRQLLGSRGGREVDAGGGEVGADRDEDDRLLWLESEHVRDGRDQLVGGVDGEAHTPEVRSVGWATVADAGAAVGPQSNEKRPLTLTDAERRLCRSGAVFDHY